MDDLYHDVKSNTRKLLGGQEQQEKSTLEEMEEAVCGLCPTMSYQTRMIGFGICLTLGVILTLGSLTRLSKLATGDPRPFVFNYSLGSLLSIASSFFFTGPWKQLKSMFSPVRIFATIIYLVAVALTIFVALYRGYIWGRGFLLILLVTIQFFAYLWYALSYIPFARRFVSGFLSGLRRR